MPYASLGAALIDNRLRGLDSAALLDYVPWSNGFHCQHTSQILDELQHGLPIFPGPSTSWVLVFQGRIFQSAL